MKILITGVTGTLGRQILRRIKTEDKKVEIIGYSRDEMKQRDIPRQSNLTLYIGDVRDVDRLVEASRGVNLLFHLAALKCVDTMEENPEECIETNVQGTRNVLHAQRVNKIPRVVLSSTDKAVKPINVYGNSKALAEKLVLRNQNNIVVRYGNVMASRGSVIPMMVQSIRESGVVNITHEEMTRFWIRPEDAADFVWSVGSSAMKGGLYIPPLSSCSVKDLAVQVAGILDAPVPNFNVIGIRAGEKLHEDLCHGDEHPIGNVYGDISSADLFRRFEPSHLKKMLTPIVQGIQ